MVHTKKKKKNCAPPTKVSLKSFNFYGYYYTFPMGIQAAAILG